MNSTDDCYLLLYLTHVFTLFYNLLPLKPPCNCFSTNFKEQSFGNLTLFTRQRESTKLVGHPSSKLIQSKSMRFKCLNNQDWLYKLCFFLHISNVCIFIYDLIQQYPWKSQYSKSLFMDIRFALTMSVNIFYGQKLKLTSKLSLLQGQV